MAKESRESSGQGIEERGTAGTVGTVNSGKFSRPMKHKNKYSNFTDPVDPAI